MRMRTFFSVVFAGFFVLSVQGQHSAIWDLRRCVEYAMANNISVRQADIQARAAEVILKQSKYSRLPSLNYSLNHGFSFGRSLNRNTNVFQDANIMFQNQSLQTGVTLFNWNSAKNSIAANQYSVEAEKSNVEKAKNDIGLTVARQYLLTLLSLEQSKVNEVQLKQSQLQFQNTQKLVEAGSLPPINALELEAQVARDSATLIQSQAQYEINKLTLKGLLNLPADESFEIAAPPVELIPVDNILELTPAGVYEQAIRSQPQIKGNNLRLQAAEKAYLSSKGRMMPTISMFGGLQTNFNNTFTQNYISGTSEQNTGYYIKSPVQQPVFGLVPVIAQRQLDMATIWNGYGNQLRNQLGKSLGFSVQVPLFNGWQSKAQVQRSKLDIESSKLAITRDTLQLKQDVYNAFQEALGSFQIYLAREKQVQTAERSFELANRRYELGVMQTIEWQTIQNNLTRAKIDKLVSQYDYVFKMKVLEFYKGQGLRL
jgi:outer membrane protein